jgi:hypothetical protein
MKVGNMKSQRLISNPTYLSEREIFGIKIAKKNENQILAAAHFSLAPIISEIIKH